MNRMPVEQYLSELNRVVEASGIADDGPLPDGWHLRSYFAGLSPVEAVMAYINEVPDLDESDFDIIGECDTLKIDPLFDVGPELPF